MMNINFPSALGYLIGVAGALIIIFSKIKNDNLADLKERVAILESERRELRELLTREREMAANQHLDNQKALSKLEGQVQQYKDLELKTIASNLKLINNSNKQILETLRGSAKAAKAAQADGGLLVKTKETNPLDVKTVE